MAHRLGLVRRAHGDDVEARVDVRREREEVLLVRADPVQEDE
jgi:hypothetical protein